jgi:hypothetical protein
VPGASRAFEFHDAWTLSVTATHYELEEVKRTSIERALVRMVVTRSDQVAVQALYRMRSARQRLLLELPAQVEFDTQPLRINGKPVSLERGDKGEFFVPLVGQSPDKAFVLELRYTAPAETASGNLEVPEFPDEPAVQKVYLSVCLPRERMLLGTGGPWSHEMDWHSAGPLKWNPVPRVNASGLYQWVVAGVNLSSNDSAHFQTDGHHYLYSTLSPDAAPDGSLSLVTMDETTVALLTFGLIVAGGLLLLKSGSSRRWSAAGVFVIAIVLVGVFAPTFSLQVMGRTTLWAVLVVGVVWTVWYVAYTRPRDPLVKARREARMQLAMGGSVVTTIPTTDGADKIEVEVESEEAPPPDDDQGSDHEGDDEGGKDDE